MKKAKRVCAVLGCLTRTDLEYRTVRFVMFEEDLNFEHWAKNPTEGKVLLCSLHRVDPDDPED